MTCPWKPETLQQLIDTDLDWSVLPPELYQAISDAYRAETHLHSLLIKLLPDGDDPESDEEGLNELAHEYAKLSRGCIRQFKARKPKDE